MDEEEDYGYCPRCNTPLERETMSDLTYCPECDPLDEIDETDD